MLLILVKKKKILLCLFGCLISGTYDLTRRLVSTSTTMPGPVSLTTRRKLGIMLLLVLEFYRKFVEITYASMCDEDAESVMTSCRLISAEIASIMVDRVTPVRIQHYVERIIPGQMATQFQENFRMTPDIFEIVLRNFAPKLKSMNKFSPITKLMDPRKQLLAVLWLLATPDSYRSVAERFNMGKSSLHKSFLHVIKVINTKSSHIIKWPQRREEIIATKFKKFANISGVIGAVDGSYIPIKAPEEYPEKYVNRKCYHAITLQAICDAELLFTDVYAGYPSSVSDRRIFTNSDIYQNIINGQISIPRGYFILGDKAYPVLNWLITPFIERGILTEQQKNFNVAVATTRQCIERAFALLKGRFRRLKYLDMSLTNFIPSVILSCCILHNICLMNGKDQVAIENFIREGMPSVDGEPECHNESITDRESDGTLLRQQIMCTLNLNRQNL